MKKSLLTKSFSIITTAIILTSTLTGCNDGGGGGSAKQTGSKSTSLKPTSGLVNTIDYSNTEIYFHNTVEENIIFDSQTCITYANNEMLISAFDSLSYDDAEALFKQYDATIVGWIEVVNNYQIQFPKIYTYQELLDISEQIAADDNIQSAYINSFTEIETSRNNSFEFIPDDYEWNGEWGDGLLGMFDDGTPKGINWGAEAIMASFAWVYRVHMAEINVGLIDSMFYEGQEDLDFAKTFFNYSDEEIFEKINNASSIEKSGYSHGTHVAATMAASFDNGKGISGIYPKGKNNLYGASIWGAAYNNSNISRVSMINYEACLASLLVNNVKVINHSMGDTNRGFAANRSVKTRFWGPKYNPTEKEKAALISLENDAKYMNEFLQKFLDKNIDFIIVTAAGNNSGVAFVEDNNEPYGWRMFNAQKDSQDDIYQESVHAQYSSTFNYIQYLQNSEVSNRIIVVGACYISGNQYHEADFSDDGEGVNIMAPGVGIYSAIAEKGFWGNDKYESWRGTSMAAPHVSGVAAMVWSLNTKLSGAEVKNILLQSAGAKVINSKVDLINAFRAVLDTICIYGTTDGKTVKDIATESAILGIVVDSEGKSFIENATVNLLDANSDVITTTVTSENGVFHLVIPDGTYTLEVSADTYETSYIENISVKLGDVKYITDIYLYKTLTDFTIPAEKTIGLGDTTTIDVVYTPINAKHNEVLWSSSDSTTVSVMEQGIITGNKIGSSTITAEATINGEIVKRECIVNVVESSRDAVLVLDVSGSMGGDPINELKKSAKKFCDDILANSPGNRVGIILFDSDTLVYEFTSDINELYNTIDGIRSGSSTNMSDGILDAVGLFEKSGRDSAIKNLVIMADGLPNEGNKVSDGYISQKLDGQVSNYYLTDFQYADGVYEVAQALMNDYNIYSLGFYHNSQDILMQETLLNSIQNMGYYNVVDGDELDFAFGDISNDIQDGSKIVIQIACPVEVTIDYNNETLSSYSEDYLTASFGNIRLLGQNNDIKIVTLDSSVDYDIQLDGVGYGSMDYSIMHYSENDELLDIRQFSGVPLTDYTKINTNTIIEEDVKLNVDIDGDGVVDSEWNCKNNEYGNNTIISEESLNEEENNASPYSADSEDIVNIIIIVVIVSVGTIFIIVIILALKSNKVTVPSSTIQGSADTVVKNTPVNITYSQMRILGGSMSNTTLKINHGERIVIGRGSDRCNLILDKDYSRVGRVHCSVTYDADSNSFLVTDLKSLNGTFLSTGERIEAGTTIYVNAGEIITLGNENCKIKLG